MVSTVNGAQSPSILAGLSSSATTPSGSTSSFTDQLAAALEGYLAQAGNSSNLEIDIQATPSQNSGVRQFVVTVKNSDASSPVQTAGSNSGASTTASTASSPSSAPSTSTAADASASNTGDPANPMAEIDAYWAAQPPAVQQLRNVADFAQRGALAQQLADQGYTIDRAIMVWGWDPLKTMLTRQMYGYTWVPNMNQPNVTAPGMALPGQTPYDASNAPAGSIAVNTDFAKGLNISDPWA